MLCKNVYSPIVCAADCDRRPPLAALPFRPRSGDPAEGAAHGPALAAVAIALAFLALAGLSHSQHILADRDPAVYINTGRSIAARISYARR